MTSGEDFGYMKDDESKTSVITKRILIVCTVLFSLVSFVYITINAYYSNHKKSEILTIKSPDFPIKVVDNVAGNDVSDIDKSVYENIIGNKKEVLREDKIKVVRSPQNIMPSNDLKNHNINHSLANNKYQEADLKNIGKSNPDLKQNISRAEILSAPLMPGKAAMQENTATLPIRNNHIIVYEKDAATNNNSNKSDQDKTVILADSPAKKSSSVSTSVATSKKSVNKDKTIPCRVQVAAASSNANAEQYWQKLSSQYPKLLGGLKHFIYQANLGSKGTFYRLQIGDFRDQMEAETFCANFLAQTKKSKAECIVVE